MEGSRFHAGQLVGPYRLIKYLGVGGFGEVWLAERTQGSITQKVDLKLLCDADEEMVRQEAEIWIRASGHPNILPVLDTDKDSNGQIYIASEFAEEGMLTDWLEANEGKAPSLEVAVRIVTYILSGLEYLHAMRPRPIIHCDLKPDNILIQDGVLRITDFGLARVLGSNSVPKMISDTPAYMAPEVLSRGDYGVASDLWAVGVIFCQLLTGSLPFPQTDLLSLRAAMLVGLPPMLPGSLPTTIRPIFTKVFQQEPANRYSSAEALRKDIEALLHSRQPVIKKSTAQPVRAIPTPTKPTPTKPTPTKPTPTKPTPTKPTPTKSTPTKSTPAIPILARPTPPIPIFARPILARLIPTTAIPTTSTQVPTPVKTTRRNFLWGIPLVGASAYGLYLLRHHRKPVSTGSGNDGSKGGRRTGQGGGTTLLTAPPEIEPIKTKINPVDGAEMVWIPDCSFQMGNDSSNFKDEKPLHTVTLSGYWIYTSLVTVAQFRKFDNANRRKYDWTENKPTWDWIDDHPMVNINRKEASAYAKWAGVALPTEAQWENAARGGLEGREYPWGNDWNSSNCANSVSPNTLYSTKPVKSYPANEYGLFDMSGNVLQWCLDWYDPDYYNTPAATQEDPICKKAETYHVLRGGSWVDENEECFRCAYRNNSTNIQIDYKYPYVGFRCVTPKLSK